MFLNTLIILMITITTNFNCNSFLFKLHPMIIPGNRTTITEHPYQVSIRYNSDHICGGSIINQNSVITAAHCTDGRPVLQVRAGSTEIDSGQLYDVIKIIQHEKFNDTPFNNDISILKIKNSFIFSVSIHSIELQSSGVEIPVGTNIIITGWGSTLEGSPSVGMLQKENIEVINISKCKKSYGNIITETMFCAQSPGKDACQGDSGGPATANNKLVGIISFGIGCARSQYPGVYAKISALRPWIDQHINN